jgi:hypothetical protein
MRGRFEKFMDAAVSEVSDMLKKDPKALEKLELTEDEKKLLTNLAAQSAREGRDVTDVVKNKKELQAAETAVANVTMEMDGPGKQGGFWQKLVERSSKPKEKPPEAPAPTAHASHEDAPRKSFAERLPERGGRMPRHDHDGFGDDRHADHGRDHHRHDEDRFAPERRERDSWSEGRKPAPLHASRFRDDGDDEGHSMLGKVKRNADHGEDWNPRRV